jgi:hypothetical protein
MPPHGFAIGQSVELSPGRLDGNVPRGTYTILRLLPNEKFKGYLYQHFDGLNGDIAKVVVVGASVEKLATKNSHGGSRNNFFLSNQARE